MNIEDFRIYCLSKLGATEDFPFDQKTLVFKVKGKMFSLTSIENFVSINLKCDPEKALELRADYAGIKPGFHMNKKHWNTVILNEDVTDQLVKELVDHSYDLVVKSLPKKIRIELTS
jgi:predicted DNA-binding protein (MmcQ/YjbR family)